MYEIFRSNSYDRSLTEFADRTADDSEIDGLEAKIRVDEGDLLSRARLLGLTIRSLTGPRRLPILNKHHAHVIWLIEHVPAEAITCECTATLEPLDEPEFFVELSKQWMRKISENVDNFDVLFNAAIFHANAGYFKDALELLSQAKKLKPRDRIVTIKFRELKSIVDGNREEI